MSEYRRQGIKRILSAQIYEELNSVREREKRNRHQFDDVMKVLNVRRCTCDAVMKFINIFVLL